MKVISTRHSQGTNSYTRLAFQLPVKSKKIIPVVISTDDAIISSRLCPLSTLSNQRTTKAPVKILKPIGSPRRPTPTGSWPYMLNDWVGQKRSTEKKLAPEMKVMTRVSARIRGLCLNREGNMGYLAPLISQNTKASRRNAPRIRGASTCEDFHLYFWILDRLSFQKMIRVPDILPIAGLCLLADRRHPGILYTHQP